MKPGIRFKKYIPALIIAAGLLAFAGCSSIPETISSWPENEIKIDGSLADWNGTVQKIPESGISIGFRNDDQFLYLCLASEDRGKILTLLKDGLITWFEPESGENNIFGICYPLSSAQVKPKDVFEMTQGGARRDDPAKMIQGLLEQQNELQVIDRNRFPLTALPLLNDEGIAARIGYSANQFVYELKVPLKTKKEFSYKADVSPGGKIRIRFESEEKLEETKGGSNLMGLSGGGQGNRRRVVPGGLMVETFHYAVELKLDSAPVKK